MKQGTIFGLSGTACLLLGAAGYLQSKIDPQRIQYAPKDSRTGAAAKVLPIEFALGAMTGFREAIAGLLWVRVDQFFHEGDYSAITPLIRIITWLDPHNTDVYETGAWHMDYNFTDQSQRSDRRYVPLAVALMREGIANNDDNPDMYADLAFTHYFRKIADYQQSRVWFEKGQAEMVHLQELAKAHPDDAGLQAAAKKAATDVTTVSHGLAHAYEACGMIPEALAQWRWCIDHHEENIKNGLGQSFGEASSLSVAKKQLNEMQLRQKYRTDLDKDQHDMKFTAQLKRIAPKVFVFSGTMDVIGADHFVLETGQRTWKPKDGCRIEIRLENQGYKMPDVETFSLNSLHLSPFASIMQDAVSVRNGKFSKKIDMSQDPDMYSFTDPNDPDVQKAKPPFSMDKYTITAWFNPSNPNDCPTEVQDRIGWLGQGMTDKNYLDVSEQVPGDTTEPIKGLRMIKKTFTLTREDIIGQGEKVFN